MPSKALPMAPAAFEQWCRARTLAPSTCDYLSTIRRSLPTRRVSSRGNPVSGTYPSRKMGVTIQFESQNPELWAIVMMDRDESVREFFEQPDTFKIRYLDKSGKKMQGHYYSPADRWVTDHWLYFYECSVGCIGILKDWLLRAVSTALDDGKNRLSLDDVQDHALPVDIYRQMALDAYEGEQRLNHTEVNREHVWRLLQGGELIAPVPPLPPREVPNVVQTASLASVMQQEEKTEDRSLAIAPLEEATPPPPVKKIRTRKKAATIPSETPEPGSVVQAEAGASPAITPPKRGRKKKTGGGEAIVPKDQEAKTSSEFTDPATARSTDVPAKPKRTRRVGEPKPKRYPVGEQEVEQGA